MVSSLLQKVLDERDDLDLFQSGFRQSYSTKTAFVALVNDPWRAQDKGGVSILALLDL